MLEEMMKILLNGQCGSYETKNGEVVLSYELCCDGVLWVRKERGMEGAVKEYTLLPFGTDPDWE